MSSIYTNTGIAPKNKYGVTGKKKVTLDDLENQVRNSKMEVEQLQAIVQSLTEKSNKLTVDLNNATENKKKALSNKELGDEVIAKAKELKEVSENTFNEIVLANEESEISSKLSKKVIDKLIYSAEVINKLANLVVRKKALNPLISDELVTMITKAGSDANNAVALTLTALQSVFTSKASILEAESSLSLEYIQAIKLYEYLIGEEVDDIENQLPKSNIKQLLNVGNEVAQKIYDSTLVASNDTTKQLNEAESELNRATIKLASLESGYAAAKAAALAS